MPRQAGARADSLGGLRARPHRGNPPHLPGGAARISPSVRSDGPTQNARGRADWADWADFLGHLMINDEINRGRYFRMQSGKHEMIGSEQIPRQKRAVAVRFGQKTEQNG